MTTKTELKDFIDVYDNMLKKLEEVFKRDDQAWERFFQRHCTNTSHTERGLQAPMCSFCKQTPDASKHTQLITEEIHEILRPIMD